MSTDWNALLAQTRSSLAHAPGFDSGPINVGSGERALSAGGGLALVGVGVYRRDGWGLASALAGLVLLHRGYTGYCFVNDLLGRDSAPRASLVNGPRADLDAVLNRSPGAVAAHLADPLQFAALFPHLAGVEDLGGGRWRLSARLPVQALGLPATWDLRMGADGEGGLSWESAPGAPILCEGALALTAGRDGGCRLRAHLSYRVPEGADPRVLHPDLAGILRAELDALVPRLEAATAVALLA